MSDVNMTGVELDVRGLVPPEPLERTLAALALLRPGQRLRLLIHREPFPLYALLDDMGYAHRTEALPGGEFAVHIEARAPSP